MMSERAFDRKVAVLVALLFAACATTSSKSSFVDREPPAGSGLLVIGRPGAADVSMLPLNVELDGKPLRPIGYNQFVRVDVPPGKHVVAASKGFWNERILPNSTPIEIDIEPGHKYFVVPESVESRPRPGVPFLMGNTVSITTTATRSSYFRLWPRGPSEPPPDNFVGTAEAP
jgi:hypothetical protein